VCFSGVSAEHLLKVSNSNVSGNRAGAGAGIYSGYAATANIETSLISNNVAEFGGGGIFVDGGSVNLTNATIWGNSTADRFSSGGGLQIGSATVTLTNVTVAENWTEGDRGGGGILNGSGTASGTINLRSSLIGDNRASQSPNQDVSGNFTSTGYNLIENRSGAAITGVQTGNIFDRDPQVGYIADNGGPTQTVALLGTSPAIDAGHPTIAPVTDQRGVGRPADGNGDGELRPDVGAYERHVTQFVVTEAADTNDRICDTDCSLREALGVAGELPPADNVVVFHPQAFAQPQTIILNQGELRIPQNGTVTVFGPGRDRLTIDGNKQTRVVLNTGSAAMRALRITGGKHLAGTGGGIFNAQRMSLEDVSVTGNEASYGGGGIGTGVSGASHLILIGSSVDHNADTGTSLGLDGGGGIDNEGGLTIEDSIIGNNSTNGRGGGVHSEYSASVTIRRSTIHDNTAFEGGGIYYITNNPGPGLQIVNCTISKNIAQRDGGGMYSPSPTTIINSTISFNSANADGLGTGQGGGIRTGSNSMLSLRNTLVSDNADNGLSPDIAGAVSSKGFNFIENTNGTTITGETVSNILRQGPLLDPRLLLNGGPTPNHALRPDSPAIDKGSIVIPGLTTDQRGRPRPYDFPSIPDAPGGNGSDIGAFERQAADVSGLEYATVSGRLFTPSGQGLRNAVVTLVDAQGIRRTASTSSFGVYSFSGVPTGTTYTIGVNSKRYRFAPVVKEVNDSSPNVDLVGLE
jgi:CSLREA domain-containing protein